MHKNKIACSLAVALVVCCSISFSGIPALGQDAPSQPQVSHNVDVNTPLHFDVSPPLRDMMKEVPISFGFHEASPVLIPHLQQLMEAAQKGEAPLADGALQMTSGPLVATTPGLNLLGVGTGFPNYQVPDAPPDTNLAVGDSQVVQWVNVSYAVFNKTTGAIIAGPILGNAFWAGFGGSCQTNNSGDIIAQWDKIAHRWVMQQNVFSSPYATCWAISQTDDATGSYFRYSFQEPGFPDYQKDSVMPEAYYQSQNNFGPGGGGFQGAYVCAYERAKMLVGDPTAKQICHQAPSSADSLLPADLDTPNSLPPSGQAEVYLGTIDGGPHVNEYTYSVNFGTSTGTFTIVGAVPGVASFSLLCGGFGACVQQKGVSDVLDSLGDRMMYRVAYRNFAGDHQTWMASHAVNPGSGGGMRWYEFRAPETSNTLSVFQQGTFAPDSQYRWMGSIAMDQSQDIALGYSLSSSSTFPSILYTGRVPTDPAGTMESEATIVNGTGSQTDTSDRWGDYSSMQIDEADDCTFWYTTEYYQTTSSFNWSTRLASFKFNNCGGTPAPNFSVSATPASQTVMQGGSTSYTATVTPSNGYTGTVTLSVIGLPSGASGSFLPNPVVITSGAQNSTLTVNTGTAAAGTYALTISGTDGTLTNSTSVSLVISPGPEGTLTPASTNFGNQVINTTSSIHKITLKSTGGAALNISSITITGANAGDFAQTNNCPGTLNVGSTCTISATFTPSVLGAESASVAVADNAVDSPQTAALTGTGIAQVTLTPASVNFGGVGVGTPSTAHNFTLTNNQSVTLNSIAISTSNPDYTETTTCGSSLAAKAHCTISVTLTPSALGADNGTLTVADDAPNTPQTAALTGTGIAAATLAPATAAFGNVPQATSSTVHNLTLTNNETLALTISSITTNNPDYTQTNTCGSSLAAKSHCIISVTFTPSILGTDNGTLTVSSSAPSPYNTLTSNLTGTGIVQAKVLPTSIAFAAQTVGTTSAAKVVTLTNNLSTALSFSGVTFSGTNPGDFASPSNTCGASVAAKGHCTINVTFKPTATGARSATMNVNDGANNSPQTVSLTGTGK